MTGPRIPMLDPHAAKAAAAVSGVPDIAAELNVFRVWLHHPKLARWLSDLLMGLLWEGSLDARLRELVIMRLGWATNSEYEWAQHWRIATGLGIDEDELLAVRDWQVHDGFGPAERAVLAATDEMVADGAISATTWQACVDHVSADEQVLLELVSAIGLWRMVSGILRSLEVPVEEGVAAWLPDGQAPGQQDR
ncbi:MAG TPA: carboxymuconolactone decarboxylase family protein [Microthrixaceae bacterium]|nr:carboxymuconolactone decarboxylase family protein [Microthrixaceae bacterium]